MKGYFEGLTLPNKSGTRLWGRHVPAILCGPLGRGEVAVSAPLFEPLPFKESPYIPAFFCSASLFISNYIGKQNPTSSKGSGVYLFNPWPPRFWLSFARIQRHYILTAAVWYVKKKPEAATRVRDCTSRAPFKGFCYGGFLRPCHQIVTA